MGKPFLPVFLKIYIYLTNDLKYINLQRLSALLRWCLLPYRNCRLHEVYDTQGLAKLYSGSVNKRSQGVKNRIHNPRVDKDLYE